MDQPCPHRPGTVVELDPDCVWSTCVHCATPIWLLYDPGDEDRAGRGWGAWRPAPVPVNAADAPRPAGRLPAVA
jgi:hypothetical protein